MDVSGITIPIADPPINCEPHLFLETGCGEPVEREQCVHDELLKDGGNAVLVLLHAVLCSVWNTGVIPTDWMRGLVVPFWKAKGDRQDCNNYRGVTLLSVPGKVFGWIILDCVRHHLL